MNTKTKRSTRTASRGVWAGVVVGGLIGAGAAVLAKRTLSPLIGPGVSELRLIRQLTEAQELLTAWDILALPVLIFVVLSTHELGHLLAGLSQGMRFLLLIIGPFSWHASVSGVRFEWNTNVSLMGGLAAATPTKVGASIRRQLLVLIAGGPVASLLLAMFALAATSVSGPRFAAYFTFIAGSSFGIFLITLMPIRSSGFLSDGLQLIDVLRGGDAVRERVALLQIFAQSAAGIRPRDWDSQVISELSRMNSADPLGGSMFLLARAMDNHNHAEIAHYRAVLEQTVDQYPAAFRQSVHVELAICAWLAGDAEAVRQQLDAGHGGIVEKSRRLLAQAALAQLEGRIEDCERVRLLAIEALAKASDAGQRKLTEDQLAMLLNASCIGAISAFSPD